MSSVLQDWVMELPLREQGTLLTCVRGCDLAPKVARDIVERYGCSTGESSPERQIVAWLRWCFMNPADPREVDIPGAFFQSTAPKFKPSEFGHYPLHWFTHVMHSCEVIGYRHPDPEVRGEAAHIYLRLATSLHLTPETRTAMIDRLSEDRIATGEVVS